MKKYYPIILGLVGLAVFAYGAYIPIKAQLAQYLIHQAWQQAKGKGRVVKPWSWMDSHPVIRMRSEKHQKDFIVLNGDTGNVLAFAPGFNPKSYTPGNGTTLISAHRDTHFEFLKNVALGDEFELSTINDERKYRYRVDKIKVINTDDQKIDLYSQQSQLKLVTCYPFVTSGVDTPLRYVISAVEIQ